MTERGWEGSGGDVGGKEDGVSGVGYQSEFCFFRCDLAMKWEMMED